MRLPEALLLTAFMICCAAGVSEAVIIRGKILNYDGKSYVGYCASREGIFVPFGEKVMPTRGGSFVVEYLSRGYGTTTVFFNGVLYRFFHKDDSEIYFEIDQARIHFPKIKRYERRYFAIADSVKQLATVKIEGSYAEVNRFYNTTERTSFATSRSVSGTHVSLLMQSRRTIPDLMATHDSLLRLETERIDLLMTVMLQEGKRPPAESEYIKTFLKNEAIAFYGSNLLNAVFLKRLEQYQQNQTDSTTRQDIYNEEWMRFVQSYSANLLTNLKVEPASHDYLEVLHQLAYTSKSYRDLKFDQTPKPLDQCVVDDIFNYDTALYRDPEVIFSLQLDAMNKYLQNPMTYSPILLQAMHSLQEKYAGSQVIKHFDKDIIKLEEYLVESSKDFHEAKFINRRFDNFNDLLKTLNGKHLLIDVWASWCQPCVQDFAHKKNIEPLIAAEKIKVLYISIDKPEWSDRWKKGINFNKLNGYHYRADEKFIKDLWTVLGGWQGAIPRYALVDDTGKIVLATAPRPGEDGNLLKEIEKMLSQ